MLDIVEVVIADVDRNASELPDRADEFEEIQAFLSWLRDGGFVFLPYILPISM